MSHSVSRCAGPLVLLVMSACTASWNALVRYSDQIAPTNESVEVGVYAAVLETLRDPYMPPITVLTSSDSVIGPLEAWVSGSPVRVPGYWADTLRREVQVALADSGLRWPGNVQLIVEAASQTGVNLVTGKELHVLPPQPDSGQPLAARLWLSRPGFNRDSTIAAIRTTYWCGIRCAHGATLVLARRPGYRWQVWKTWLHWIS